MDQLSQNDRSELTMVQRFPCRNEQYKDTVVIQGQTKFQHKHPQVSFKFLISIFKSPLQSKSARFSFEILARNGISKGRASAYHRDRYNPDEYCFSKDSELGNKLKGTFGGEKLKIDRNGGKTEFMVLVNIYL